MPYFPQKDRHLHNTNDKVDALVIMLTMMVKHMFLVKTQQGCLGPDRIESVPGNHSLNIPSYDIDSL